MRRHLRWRTAVVLAAVGAVAVAALATTGSASAGSKAAPDQVTVTVKGKGENLHFVTSSKSVQSGGDLVIDNQGPKGEPHTFSLVKSNVRPSTAKQQRQCFKKGHICRAICNWHKCNPQTGDIKVNPVDVGKTGWDTEGDLKNKGDSVFFMKPHNPDTAPVSAAAGTTLHFMCAVHPWMQGTIHVK
jgi:hypothetical protein